MKDDPQYIYAEGGETQKFVETTLEVAIEHATKVSTYINPSSLITKEDFDTEIEKITEPEFDDSGEVTGITSFPTFLEKVKSKMNFFDFFKNLKAGLKFVLHTGQIVNNCVSDNAELPLSAMQGKVLMDLINQTNGNLDNAKIQDSIFVKDGESVLDAAKTKLGSDGIHFITIREAPDIPFGFNFCSGIVVHRADTLSVVLFSRVYSSIAINSWISNEQQKWTGWKICIMNSDLVVETFRTAQFTIPANSGFYYNDLVSPQKPGYMLLSFLNGYPEGFAGIIVQSNGWAYNPTPDSKTIAIITRWLFIKV